jgi:hypothetical protein
MRWQMKCWARAALGLGAAALLLAGVPVQARAASGPPDAALRETQSRLLAQSTTKPGEAEQLEKTRQAEQRKKAAKEISRGKRSQQPQPRMRTRGPMPEAAPEAMPSAPGSKRFGAGVVRDKESGEQ